MAHWAGSNDNGRFWANDEDDLNPWIQVNLGSRFVVKELLTKGHTNSSGERYWVEKIKVKVGMSQECITFIKDDDGIPKVHVCVI